MQADRLEVSWDTERSKWLVRIEAGDEVIRRRFDAPQSMDDRSLRNFALKESQEEGYEVADANISIKR